MTIMDTNKDGIYRQYNSCFDFIKGIACICVVFMHCEFPDVFGTAVQTISRFCVPFFFMISGYYSYYNEGEGHYNASRKITHIAKITIFATLFYLFMTVVLCLIFGGSLSFPLQKIIVNWLIFNQPVLISGHLWFLFALLYDYILFSLAYRLKIVTVATWTIPILILAYIALAQGAHLAGVKIPNMIYRNFLIEGFPLFMSGYWLHQNSDKVIAKCSDGWLLFLLCASTVACLLERMALGRDFGVNIATFPQLACLFILGMKHPGNFSGSSLGWIGKRLSMLIYVLHMFVWRTLVNRIYSFIHISQNPFALYLKPIVVLVATIVFSYAIVFCMDSFKHRKNKTQESVRES